MFNAEVELVVLVLLPHLLLLFLAFLVDGLPHLLVLLLLFLLCRGNDSLEELEHARVGSLGSERLPLLQVSLQVYQLV